MRKKRKNESSDKLFPQTTYMTRRSNMDREKRLREMCNAIFRDRFKDVDVPVNMRYIRKPNMTFDYLVKDTMMSISVPLVLIELPTEYQRAVADAIHLKYEGKNKELEELRKTMKRYAKDGKLTKYAGAYIENVLYPDEVLDEKSDNSVWDNLTEDDQWFIKSNYITIVFAMSMKRQLNIINGSFRTIIVDCMDYEYKRITIDMLTERTKKMLERLKEKI